MALFLKNGPSHFIPSSCPPRSLYNCTAKLAWLHSSSSGLLQPPVPFTLSDYFPSRSVFSFDPSPTYPTALVPPLFPFFIKPISSPCIPPYFNNPCSCSISSFSFSFLFVQFVPFLSLLFFLSFQVPFPFRFLFFFFSLSPFSSLRCRSNLLPVFLRWEK